MFIVCFELHHMSVRKWRVYNHNCTKVYVLLTQYSFLNITVSVNTGIFRLLYLLKGTISQQT